MASRTHPRGLAVALEGIEDRNAAERLRGLLVFVDTEDLSRPSQGGWWEHEVVGLEVRDLTGRLLGEITAVHFRDAQDLWEVETGTGKVLLPAAKEIVRGVSIETRTVTVEPPRGLFGDDGE